jgi:hypothetical protein
LQNFETKKFSATCFSREFTPPPGSWVCFSHQNSPLCWPIAKSKQIGLNLNLIVAQCYSWAHTSLWGSIWRRPGLMSPKARAIPFDMFHWKILCGRPLVKMRLEVHCRPSKPLGRIPFRCRMHPLAPLARREPLSSSLNDPQGNHIRGKPWKPWPPFPCRLPKPTTAGWV